MRQYTRGMGDCYPANFVGPLPDGSTYCVGDPAPTVTASSPNYALWIAAALGLFLFIPLLTGGRR